MDSRVQVYSTTYCGFCVRAKALLSRLSIPFQEVDVTEDDSKRQWLVAETGQRTVPQIFIDGRPIGGFSELIVLERKGELQSLVAAA